jgi:predicted nucleic acid-binding protein
VIIFDSTYLIAFLHPSPNPPKDEHDKPVERFKDRIQELVKSLNSTDIRIGVPTPVVAEILVQYPDNKSEYLEVIRDRYRFEVVPFGVKAAIEASDLIALLSQETKQPASQWQKVKFDIQIAATAKAESATMLYADDKGIVSNAKRLGINAKRICDLPLPADEPEPQPVILQPMESSGQTRLFENGTNEIVEEEDEREEGTQPHPVTASGDAQGSGNVSIGNIPEEVTKEAAQAVAAPSTEGPITESVPQPTKPIAED